MGKVSPGRAQASVFMGTLAPAVLGKSTCASAQLHATGKEIHADVPLNLALAALQKTDTTRAQAVSNKESDPSDAARRRKEEMQHIRPTTGLLDDRDEDWRDTLFYWHGRVTWVGGERNVVSWRGSWLSTVASHAPPAADFSSSFNFFELNFDVDPMRRAVRDWRHGQFATGDMDLRALFQLSGEFRGHYLMEPPDGAGYRRAYRDDAHEFEFDDRIEDPPPEMVQAIPCLLERRSRSRARLC